MSISDELFNNFSVKLKNVLYLTSVVKISFFLQTSLEFEKASKFIKNYFHVSC